jgi:ParB family chromosome partitioning protein
MKKKFNISGSLSQGIKQTIDIVENNQSKLRNAIIPLSRIEPDPQNPRSLSITVDDIKNGLTKSDPLYTQKELELQKLVEIANTIKKSGILNPILVYKHDNNYRIVAGERRFLAALSIGMTEIDARIYNEKPRGFDLKLAQWVENTAREDLTLADRIGNIYEMIKAFKVIYPTAQINATWLKDKTGLSLSQANYYFTVLNAPDDLKSAINDGYITSLDKAATIAAIVQEEKRKLAISSCREGISLVNLRKMISSFKAENNNKTSKKRGRGVTYIKLGMTKNPKVVEEIIKAIIQSDKFKHYDKEFAEVKWENINEVANAFKKLMNLLDRAVVND